MGGFPLVSLYTDPEETDQTAVRLPEERRSEKRPAMAFWEHKGRSIEQTIAQIVLLSWVCSAQGGEFKESPRGKQQTLVQISGLAK